MDIAALAAALPQRARETKYLNTLQNISRDTISVL